MSHADTVLPLAKHAEDGEDTEEGAAIVPGAHKNPTAHGPVQAGDDKPMVLPKVPAGHAVHDSAPGGLYRPAGHSAVQAARTRPLAFPKRPAAHAVHVPAPLVLN